METAMRISLGILSSLYFLLSCSCLIQLVRIHYRNPRLAWTTQKTYLVLTFVMGIMRTILFVLAQYFDANKFEAGKGFFIAIFFSDLPSLLYFSTYTLLILFWAKIINQAETIQQNEIGNNASGNNSNNNGVKQQTKNPEFLFKMALLKRLFIICNICVYLIQLCIWILILTMGQQDETYRVTLTLVDYSFYGILSFLSALGFLIFGGRLFFLIKHLPGNSSAKYTKQQEVGFVTLICTLFFTLRSILTFVSAFDEQLVKNWIFVFLYYILTEILPSCLVFFVLGKLPPKKEDNSSRVRKSVQQDHESLESLKVSAKAGGYQSIQ